MIDMKQEDFNFDFGVALYSIFKVQLALASNLPKDMIKDLILEFLRFLLRFYSDR